MEEKILTLISTAIEFDLTTKQSKEIAIDKIEVNPADKSKIYWIHGDLRNQEQYLELVKKLKLPQEAINVSLHDSSSKKFIDAENSLTVKISDILCIVPKTYLNFNSKSLTDTYIKGESLFGKLFIYLTDQICFTATYEPLLCTAKFREDFLKNIKFALTPGFILFLIIDNVISNYSDILHDYEMAAEKLDDAIRELKKGTYSDVINIKNQIVKIKSNISTLRNVLLRVSTRKISVISDSNRQSLSNLLEHIQLLIIEVDSIREILNGILDFLNNRLMRRMNKSVQIIKNIFLVGITLFVIAVLLNFYFHWIGFGK